MRVCVVQRSLPKPSETFIRAHGERLRDVVAIVHRDKGVVFANGQPSLPRRWPRRHLRRLALVLGRTLDAEIEAGYLAALRQAKPDVVLAEYGLTGVRIRQTCRAIGVPLVVHFHGYDAYNTDILHSHAAAYQDTFAYAGAVIAVSRAMERQLMAIGCPAEKLIYSPYGVDCEDFEGAAPSIAEPTFLSVGRMVEKKAPYLTLMAFASVVRSCPQARLRMIGDGPLLPICRVLADALRISGSVDFLGAQTHDVVRSEMRRARAFVQHSITSADGDSEGTPVAILEAGAVGLPVVATRHGGIPDVVVEGETGLLVDERDVTTMSERMTSLADDPAYSQAMGDHAADRVRRYYTMNQSLNRLERVLMAVAAHRPIASVRADINGELPPSGHPRSSNVPPRG